MTIKKLLLLTVILFLTIKSPINIAGEHCKYRFTDANNEAVNYIGQCQNGMAHGYGRIAYENGDILEGNFERNIVNGYGIYTWANGDRYSGAWKDSKKNGYGIFTWANNDRYSGKWENDRLSRCVDTE